MSSTSLVTDVILDNISQKYEYFHRKKFKPSRVCQIGHGSVFLRMQEQFKVVLVTGARQTGKTS
jgi:hypothetical protein